MEIAEGLKEPLKQELGLDQETKQIFSLGVGVLPRLSPPEGAVGHPAMEQYAKSCNFFAFIYSRTNRLWLPKMGLNSFHPVFLSLSGNARFDRIRVNQGMTWYRMKTGLRKFLPLRPRG